MNDNGKDGAVLPAHVDLTGAPDGVYVVGALVGYREAAEARTVGTRQYRNCDVGVQLDGGTIETVNYSSLAAAREATGNAAQHSRVALRAEVRYGVKDGRPWMFYAGAGQPGRSSEAFASSFTV